MVESMWVGVGSMVECMMWVGGRLCGGVYVGGWSALWWSLCGWVVGCMLEYDVGGRWLYVGGQSDTGDEESDERRRQTCNNVLHVFITGM